MTLPHLPHQSWYVYIIECADKTLYTGMTSDIQKRIDQHNGLSFGGAKYTRGRRPVCLAYLERFDSRGEAAKRERQIKNLTRSEKEVLIKMK